MARNVSKNSRVSARSNKSTATPSSQSQVADHVRLSKCFELLDTVYCMLRRHKAECKVSVMAALISRLSGGSLTLDMDVVLRLCGVAPRVVAIDYSCTVVTALQQQRDQPTNTDAKLDLLPGEGMLGNNVQIFLMLRMVGLQGVGATHSKRRKALFAKQLNDPKWNTQVAPMPPLPDQQPVDERAHPPSPMHKSQPSSSSSSQLHHQDSDNITDNNTNVNKKKTISAAALDPQPWLGLRDTDGNVRPEAVVRALELCPFYEDQIKHLRRSEPRMAQFGELEHPLAPALQHALAQRGLSRLFSHQVKAIDAVRRGECDVVISTSTASGKSLVYNLPVVEAIAQTWTGWQHNHQQQQQHGNHSDALNCVSTMNIPQTPHCSGGGWIEDNSSGFGTAFASTIDSSPTALYIFPTKALSQDQLFALQAIADQVQTSHLASVDPSFVDQQDRVQVMTYDGDTPKEDRALVRQHAQVVITNPDMLHMSILPHHSQWQRFLSRLRFVVLDEAHMYSGAFGSHVGCVIRRLLRVCALHGGGNGFMGRPQFISCSATIANPLEVFRALVPAADPRQRQQQHQQHQQVSVDRDGNEKDEYLDAGVGVCVVDHTQDGSPRNENLFVIWNPSLRKNRLGNESLGAAATAAHMDVANPNNKSRVSSRRSNFNSNNEKKQMERERLARAERDALTTLDTDQEDPLSASSSFNTSIIIQNMNADVNCQHELTESIGTAVSAGISNADVVSLETASVIDNGEEEDVDNVDIDVGQTQQQQQQLERKSAIFETAVLLATLVRMGVKTLAFCRTRKLVELVLKYALAELERGYGAGLGPASVAASTDYNDTVSPYVTLNNNNAVRGESSTNAHEQQQQQADSLESMKSKLRKMVCTPSPSLTKRLAGYRGGYSKQERRAIETELFSHQLLGVTATCALELGVDIGSLDAVIVLGFPGSVASLTQQIGRSGRSGRKSLAIMVCFNGVVDQHLCKNPTRLFDPSSLESTILDPSNPLILRSHLVCAAAELPLGVCGGNNTNNNNSSHQWCGRCSVDPDACLLRSVVATNDAARFGGRGDLDLLARQNSHDITAKVVGTTTTPTRTTTRTSTARNSRVQSLVEDLLSDGILYPVQPTWSFSPSDTCPSANNKGNINGQDAVSFSASSCTCELSATHPKVKRPATGVSLRTIDKITFDLINDCVRSSDSDTSNKTGSFKSKRKKNVLDTVPYRRAFFELYPGAIYMHQGKSFLVTKLDLKAAKAHCIPTAADYYTSPRDSMDVNIIHRFDTVAQPTTIQPIPITTATDIAASIPSSIVSTASTNVTISPSVYNRSAGASAAANATTANATASASVGDGSTEGKMMVVVAHTGVAEVEMSVWGYRKMSLKSGRVLSMHEFTLPPLVFQTMAVWLSVPEKIQRALALANATGTEHARNEVGHNNTNDNGSSSGVVGGLHAASHAIARVIPQLMVVAPSEIGIMHMTTLKLARLVVFDTCPGGTGVAEAVFQNIEKVLRLALELIEKCECVDGCLMCIWDMQCSAKNQVLCKETACVVLRGMAIPDNSNIDTDADASALDHGLNMPDQPRTWCASGNVNMEQSSLQHDYTRSGYLIDSSVLVPTPRFHVPVLPSRQFNVAPVSNLVKANTIVVAVGGDDDIPRSKWNVHEARMQGIDDDDDDDCSNNINNMYKGPQSPNNKKKKMNEKKKQEEPSPLKRRRLALGRAKGLGNGRTKQLFLKQGDWHEYGGSEWVD